MLIIIPIEIKINMRGIIVYFSQLHPLWFLCRVNIRFISAHGGCSGVAPK